MYGLPLGLQMLLDHSSLNSSDWSVLQLAYNAQGPYASATALAAAFDAGALDVLRYPRPASDSATAPLWTSMRRRGAARALETRAPPSTVPQGGDRFAVRDNQVSWLSWDLHIGYEIAAGITFHDIRFRNERVIYELALQDAYASYSGSTPIQALSQYSDAGWGMGYSNFMLIPGVDCPAHATFLNTSHFVDGASTTNVNAVCVWEHPEDVAIMRHYDQDFSAGEGFMFAAGVPKTVLVVRTTSTVYNYDCA
jgi:Cu2+-containing amine oxidase